MTKTHWAAATPVFGDLSKCIWITCQSKVIHFEAQGITIIAKCHVIESLSCIWQDTQEFLCQHDRNPLSSYHSCPCQKLWLQPNKDRQVPSCLSPVWSPGNNIHCQMCCDRIIVMVATRHSGFCLTSLQKAIEQLSLLSLPEIVIIAAAQGETNWQLLVPSLNSKESHSLQRVLS